MTSSVTKPELPTEPLTPSQSKAQKLIEELTGQAVEEQVTEAGSMAKEFLQGIWHGNAVPSTPRQKKRPESKEASADKEAPDDAP